MSCLLNQGRALPCKDSTGSVKTFYLGNFSELSGVTFNSTGGLITGITSTNVWYEFQVPKESSAFEEVQAGNVQNGTNTFTQTLTIVVNKWDYELRDAIYLLATGTLVGIIKDQNGKYWFAGYQNGLDMTEATGGTGTAFADRNGYSITLTGVEPKPSFEVDPSVIATLNITI